jgi:hypothetical protein
MAIVSSIAEALKAIDGGFPYQSDIEGRAETSLKFWSEVDEFPSIHITPGPESRQYQGGGYKDRFLTVTVRVYVKDEDKPLEKLEALIEDIETVLEALCSRMEYVDRQGNSQFTHQISIISIDTDEGVLAPYGVGEILCEVRY